MLTTTSELTGLDYDEMELTLGLPGELRERKFGKKRQFSNLSNLKLGNSENTQGNESDSKCSDSGARKPPLKEQVMGWPPVRSHRKNAIKNRNCKYVKVAVDGAPYLRKVDLQSYTDYQQLLCVFGEMFSCFTIGNVLNEKNMMDHVNRIEHVPIYEDKDGDWMLVGDVPWKMFVETCKRIRLMKSSEAINQLAPKTLLKS